MKIEWNISSDFLEAVYFTGKHTHTHTYIYIYIYIQGHCITMSRSRAGALDKYDVTDGVQYVDTYEAHTFLWPLSP